MSRHRLLLHPFNDRKQTATTVIDDWKYDYNDDPTYVGFHPTFTVVARVPTTTTTDVGS